MSRVHEKRSRWLRRKRHIRQTLRGSATRPRLTIYKSNRYTYIQVIDDDAGRTVAAVSNREQELRSVSNDLSGAAQLGESLAARLAAKQIHALVFDRNGYRFTGRVRAVAEGVRKAGIQI
jgi:large subunit ribosomal protein L18